MKIINVISNFCLLIGAIGLLSAFFAENIEVKFEEAKNTQRLLFGAAFLIIYLVKDNKE